MNCFSALLFLNLLAVSSTFGQRHPSSNAVQINTSNGMTIIKTPPNSCIYMNEKVYDNGIERPASPQEVAMIAQNEQDWNNWSQEFNAGMQKHLAQSFPPGFPFNQPKTKLPEFLPPKTPVLPCFCVHCDNQGGNYNIN
uniref:Secreted protein n=1 Tax=Ditylenchus dipsaci TaxID=166011 RepID=A0A915CXT3_9BILA